jgi:hypothetical protein
MVVQAGSFAPVLRQPVLAAPHCVEPANDRQCTPQLTYVGIGTEVSCSRHVSFAGNEYTGECFAQRDGDGWVALVVLEADVESRPVLLDEVVFEQQRPGFAWDHDGFDISDKALQKPVSGTVGKVRGEVAAHAATQSLCLADVQDLPVSSLPQVHTRSLGESIEFALEFLGYWGSGHGISR